MAEGRPDGPNMLPSPAGRHRRMPRSRPIFDAQRPARPGPLLCLYLPSCIKGCFVLVSSLPSPRGIRGRVRTAIFPRRFGAGSGPDPGGNLILILILALPDARLVTLFESQFGSGPGKGHGTGVELVSGADFGRSAAFFEPDPWNWSRGQVRPKTGQTHHRTYNFITYFTRM